MKTELVSAVVAALAVFGTIAIVSDHTAQDFAVAAFVYAAFVAATAFRILRSRQRERDWALWR